MRDLLTLKLLYFLYFFKIVLRTRAIEFRITHPNIMCFEKLRVQTKENGGRNWNLLQHYDPLAWDPKQKGLV